MFNLLVIEDNPTLCKTFNDLLVRYTNFHFDIVATYEQARKLVRTKRYQVAVTDLSLLDAKGGKIIPLLNKHNIAPLIFTKVFDEEFCEGFETAQIIDYILKDRVENILYVIQMCIQLEQNTRTKVLIVDDSILYANFTKQNLQMHHFKVITALNAKEALHKLELHPDIELIITNYHTPKSDGLELVRSIREKYTKKELRIINLSSSTNSYTTSRFLKEGANDYIKKPFSRDEFYTRIYQNIETVTMFEDMERNFWNEAL